VARSVSDTPVANPPTPAARRAARRPPTLRVERRLLRGGATLLAAMDEVGRGSPAGPVYVGVVVVDGATPPAPAGVRDSKLVPAMARESLVPSVEVWAVDSALGAASAAEVDRLGIIGALGQAGRRALAGLSCRPDLVLLDGAHDWLSPALQDGDGGAGPKGSPSGAQVGIPARTPLIGIPVVTRVRADLTCASVAAASILAKVARDAVMTELAGDFPGYGWEANKGYGTPDHLEALRRLGPTPHHRVTWRLPGCG